MLRNPPLSLSIPFILTVLSPYLMPAMATTSAPSTLPQVDFSKMGSVGLGGSFSGLDWWSTSSPFASSTSSTSTAFSTDGDTVFVRKADGSYEALGSTNSGGTINSLCWSNSTASGSSNGTLYIGGSFTSVDSTSASNILAYSLSDSTFRSLSDGLTGPVNTLYCDNANNEVWAGGSFNLTGNVALWSTSSSTWEETPFGGLNGPVQDISSNGTSIYFSGAFATSYLSNSSVTTNTTSNYTSTQSAPSNTSTVGHSGYLTPVTMPSSSSASGNLTITAGPATDQDQYSDADVLLCPGEGTWLGEDNTVAQIDIKGYSYWMAAGARVANAQVEGRGATAFCITSLPDNTQLNMTYTDPTTGKNETCWEYCPLSTDPSIGAQDFLFTDGSRNLTGLQMELKRWIGDGPGLSSVQLLSDGAYGSAVEAGNTGVCTSSKSSTAGQTGNWTQSTIDTDIPATTAYYLTSTVPVSTPTYPSVTFYPYVSASGFYDVYVLIPGCEQIGDCAGRTSVDMEVFPIHDSVGWTSTISEQVQQDAKTLVYSGWVDATSDAFTPTIILALAKSPEAPSGGDNYVVVAQAVQLTLTGLGTEGTTSTAGSNSTSNSTVTQSSASNKNSSQSSFGVFEWSRSSASGINAQSPLVNTTETALTHLGFGLETALNSTSSSGWSVNAVASLNGIIYVGGDFSATNNYSNVLSVDTSTGQVTPLANEGLDGTVYAVEVVGQYVYFGGDFTSTLAGGVGLAYVARYDPSSKSWASVAGGVDGTVSSLSSLSSQLVVLGNFSHVIASNGTSTQTGGYAVYDTSSSSWSVSGAVFGTLAAAATADDQTFLAGKVVGSSSNLVNGVAILSSSDGSATIDTLDGVALSAPSASASSVARRSVRASRRNSRSLFSRFAGAIVARGHPVLFARATAPTITSTSAPAPAVLAGAFWTNSSASGNAQSVTIIGGNFSVDSGVSGVAFYANDQLTGPNPPVQGVVRALAVVGDSVYIGGTGVNATNVGSVLVVYDLKSNSWVTGGMPSLNPSTSTANVVRQRTNTNTIVVTGNFTTAGSLSCAALCLWDSEAAQWHTPGSGLSSGEVRAMDFVGDNYDAVAVAGSFIMSDGTVAYAATYAFDNSTWTALGSLPGPALAIAADNKNASNIFAAGYSTTDNSPYLQQWDGKAWAAQNTTLLPGSVVQQLAFVPMSTEHTPVGSIEKNRMLMVSGDLYLKDAGNASSALFDGASWYPYLVGTSSTGSLGAASALFWSETTFSFDVRHFLACGLVVLVAIAIATGLILLLILLALLIAFLTRRSERRSTLAQREMFEKEGSEISSTHQNVFHGVQAALEQSLGGGAAAAAVAAASARRTSGGGVSAESEYDAAGEEEEGEEGGRETTMRYDFDGPELQPGEMAMRAGQAVVILDDVQSPEWWYARDPATGREGVIPASYVW